ncbi:MAG: amino acid adenylation domain-containing protein [Acidobacteria bacterium]|nr:amino acid adenylation domain-containing protein [Acidobacteriota bacterium]
MTINESSTRTEYPHTVELSVPAPAETRRLVERWNDTAVAYPQAQCLHRLFEDQVARTPDAIALTFEGCHLTYRELNERANRLAHYLVRAGVAPDSIVPICIERSIEMVVGLYGILKAGAAYLPLDPAYPTERLAFMLDDCRSTVLLTERRLLESMPAHEARVICLDADWPEIEMEAEDNLSVDVAADNLAYVIYTSGSTGKPKGAMNTHAAICNRLLWMQDAYRLDATDCVLQKTPFSFDVSVWEFFWPLLTGARLVVARPLGHHDNTYLADVIVAERVTTIHFVPPMLQVFLEEPELKKKCASLRRVICSGEALPYDLQRRFFSHLDAELHNLYGPTEAAVDVTFWQCERDGDLRVVPIGRPIANTHIYLLDERLEPVQVGVVGELHIGGVCLARGYPNRMELTAERFIPDPLSRDPGGRLYKTGDLARYLPDGAIEYMGRIDHQVKMSGVRIELGEIEAAIVEHTSIREAVVLSREDAPGNKRLVAYLVSTSAMPPDTELRAFLLERLPHYMVPSAYIWMEKWPLTSSGKVDRLRLPAPVGGARDERPLIMPRTPVEELIAGHWCELMLLPEVGVDDNFFDLGGHSLLASMLIARLRRELRADLNVPDVFESPTVAQLAAKVEARRRNGWQASAAEPIERRAREGPQKLSYAQQRLWFLHQLKPDSAFYNLPLVFRLRGPLNLTALEASLGEISRRHEMLRARFIKVDGEPRYVVKESSPVHVALVDVSMAEEGEREMRAQWRVSDAVRAPFDLANNPPWRSVVVRLGAEENILCVVMHHIISDGWSMDVFTRELSALYADYAAGREPSLAELPIQYADYAAWQRHRLSQGAEDAHLSYWREQLVDGRTVLRIPSDRPRPAVESYEGRTHRATLSAPLTQSLRALSRRESSTLYMALLAAFNVLLHRYTGETDISVGTPLAGRDRTEIESLIGFFVNTVVIRTRISGRMSFRDLLRRVRETTLAAYAHQELPFERIVEELEVERSLSHAPLFQVVFAFNNAPRRAPELTGLEGELLETDTATAKFDLALLVEDAGAELKVAIEYSTQLFDPATIECLTGHLEMLLAGIVADPDRHLSTLPLLTDAESDRLISQWNDTRREFLPRVACIHELLEKQAELRPDACAVASGNERLTYSELNARANRLARRLSALGVGSETPVAVCAGRSARMVVGALGVLKAGGAYVPLDPQYPRERLRLMLEETGAPVLLTEHSLIDRLPHCRAQVLYLDEDAESADARDEDNPCYPVWPQNLAYIIYTSGSTGRPKGVAVQHGGLVNLAHWHRETYGVDERTRASQVAGYSFDASVWEVWPYLAAGASVSMVDDETLRSPAQLWRWVKSEGITHCFVPTPLAESMLQNYEHEAGVEDSTSDALRYLFTGGDKLHQFLADDMPFRLVNVYGPSENTVASTVADVGSAPRPDASPHIGRPIANTRVYILDEHLRPVPVGVPGELYVAGCGLARGYLNHPALTAERFIPDPFSGQEDLKVQAEMSEAMKDTSGLSAEERAALAMQLKRKGDTSAAREFIARRGESGPAPLSFAQQRLWFLNVMEPNSPYIIWTNFHLKGRLDAPALERTLNEIVRRHESLRTTFSANEGQPVQLVTPHLTLGVPIHDLSDLDEGARSSEVEQHKQEMQRPFDLARGPLFRARLLRLDADEHILLLAMHHIVTDGWSIGIMLREMTTLYEAFTAGRAPALPQLSIQYRDFAAWQREWLSGAELERQLAYWRENLRGAPPALELPTDRPRPPVQSYRGETLEREIGKKLTGALKELSRARGVTLYMTLLAAFKTLLYRYTGQHDIVVGTPIANRNRMEIENLIGFFVNTLVLRTSLSPAHTFSELLTRVRDVTLRAFAHQDLPFEKLVEELQPERDMSRTPLFQVMFSLQNEPLPPLRLGGVTMRLLDDEMKTAQFDLTLDLIERDEGILSSLEFNTDLFDRETAERMFGHYLRLLEEIVTNPDRHLLELPFLTDEEQHRVIVEWNDTAREYPRDRCVHELFEEQVTRRPEAVALIVGGERLTYAELNARANQLAHYLRRAGLRPESRAGLVLERNAEAAVALLGVLKAGGAYVAFDPSYPAERVRQMLEDAGASILLTTRRLADGLTGRGAKVVCLDAERSHISAESAENPAHVAHADNLAYLVYTSGTTGRPKGILIQHRSLANAIYAFITHHRVSERDRILQFASLSFDVATEEFFAAWLSGARLVMRPESAVVAPEQFVRFLEEEGVTLVNLPASFWAEWATAITERGCKMPAQLRRVVVGNEKTLPESLAKWQCGVGHLVTWSNAYGPSETTITASNYEPQRGEGREGASAVPIGRPVMNATMYVLDQAQQLVPVGVAGELCIGGVGLARGYHGQPGQTAERFTPNRYDAAGGERMYRTGDLARYLPDGNIEFLGRVDEQVKVRGFRIELGEIETVLSQHEGVREAVIVARPDERGNNRLVAYVVESAGRTATAGELRHYLKETLPEYMIPSAFVTLDALPLTPNGKVDRKHLPDADGSRPELEEVYVAPRSELEREIANVWQEVLKVEKVGVHDNFFNLGGHSLLIVQVNSRLHEILRGDVSLIDMFKYPTVSALAEYLSRESPTPAARATTQTRLEATERQRQMRQRQQQAARRRKGRSHE